MAGPTRPDLEQVLRQAEPLLQAIVAAATDASQREALAPGLGDLESESWCRTPAGRDERPRDVRFTNTLPVKVGTTGWSPLRRKTCTRSPQ